MQPYRADQGEGRPATSKQPDALVQHVPEREDATIARLELCLLDCRAHHAAPPPTSRRRGRASGALLTCASARGSWRRARACPSPPRGWRRCSSGSCSGGRAAPRGPSARSTPLRGRATAGRTPRAGESGPDRAARDSSRIRTGLREPPPPTTTSSGRPGRKRRYWSAIECAVNAVSVATNVRAAQAALDAAVDERIDELGAEQLAAGALGRLQPESTDRPAARPAARRRTRPARPVAPSASKRCMPPLSRQTAWSISALPGPVSKASIASHWPPGGTQVTLPMPPMFCTARLSCWSPNNSASPHDASGAPWPPAAMSRGRKSATVVTPSRSAITDGSASCSVERVWPGADLVPDGLAVRGHQVGLARRPARRPARPPRRTLRRAGR